MASSSESPASSPRSGAPGPPTGAGASGPASDPVWPAALALLAIAAVTLVPSSGPPPPRELLCLFCGERGGSDALLNVVLFAPLGIALGVRRSTSVRRAVVLGIIASAIIEAAQGIIPGRDPSPADVLFNGAGTAFGSLLARSAGLWRSPPGRWADGPGLAALVAAVAAIAATGLLLRPAYPRGTYYGQWTADLGHLERYEGQVLDARVGGTRVRDGPVADSERLRRLLGAGAPIQVAARAGPAVDGLAPIFSIFDDRRREIVLIGVDGGDAIFRFRTRSALLRLDRPDARLRGAFEDVRAGDPLALAVRRSGGGVCLEVDRKVGCGLGPTVGRGWSLLLYPEAAPAWLLRVLDLCWLVGLFAPAGFWLRRRPSAFVAVGLGLAALAALPRLVGLLPTTAPEYAAALAGGVLGAVAGRVTGMRRRCASDPGDRATRTSGR